MTKYVKITKYNKTGEVVSEELVDGFKDCYDNPPGKIQRTSSTNATWGSIITKTCPLCKVDYTARNSAGARCYRCQYHITRVAHQKPFAGRPLDDCRYEVIEYLKKHPEILSQPAGGWFKDRHEESVSSVQNKLERKIDHE